MADFREQQEYLRVEDGASTKARMDRALKLKNLRFLSRNRYIKTTLFFVVFVFAMVTAQVGWVLFGQERDGTPIFQSATLDSRYFNALESPAADKLEERISRLTGNMETLSGLLADLESKLIATDQVEERISSLNENLEKLSSMTTDLESRQVATDKLDARISGLTENMETLNSLTTDLESRQLAADGLEERISKITKDLEILSDLAAGVESHQRAPLATTSTVVPVTQKLVFKTTELLTVAKETPTIETKFAPVAVSPGPKLDTDSPKGKRETSRAVPKERQASVVSKQHAAGVSKNRTWTINLISSPDKAYAVSFSDTAQSRGISTELQEVSVKGTPYWRVQVTGFSTQDEAKIAADTVKDKLGMADIWIMKR